MIGIFDSGIGGLTVVKEIFKILPQYQIIYLGDTARLPYGSRSPESIYKFTVEAVDFLFKQNCGLVILACNTASAVALRKIQKEWLPVHYPDRRVLGVIRPVAEKAAQISRFGRIGVVGTRATISSESYIRELQAQKAGVKIFQQACPLLVPLIEEGWGKRPETKKIIKYYLRPLKTAKVDTLILGCTHYPILLKIFQEVMGKQCRVLNSGLVTAESLKDYLARHPEIESKLVKGSKHRFLATELTDTFKNLAGNWLGSEVEWEKVGL